MGIVFLMNGVIFAINEVDMILKTGWLFYVVIVIAIIAIVYAIISSNKYNKIKSCPEEGIFVLKGQIDNELASELIKGMLKFSDKCPDKTITLYINSEGGSVTAGMAVYDTMLFLRNSIRTIAYKRVGGISSLLLVAGTKGMREALKSTRISIGSFFICQDEQPSELLNSVLEKVLGAFVLHTKNTEEQMQDMIRKRKWLCVKKAIKFGLIDVVTDKNSSLGISLPVIKMNK